MAYFQPAPHGPATRRHSISSLDNGESIYQVLEPGFSACIDLVAQLEVLHEGLRWAEGPVYFADHRSILFSDIPNERILRYDENSGHVSTFRAGSGHANGNVRDLQGRLVTCEQGTGRVTRTELDGSVAVLADTYRGSALNAPNDIVVRSDGTIWFTDPSYGRETSFVGVPRPSRLTVNGVYRLEPESGAVTLVADDFWKPNGLAFSPDESKLYVVDSGFLPHPEGPRHIRAFDVDDDGMLGGGEVLAEIMPGIPDGISVDSDGRIWVGAGDGVQCLRADGALIGKIRVPEAVANLTFGGPKRNRLYIAASTSLYAIFTNVTGAQRP